VARKGNEVFEGARQSMAPRRDVLKDDFGFEVPVQAVPLPSGGVIYPVDSPMHGKTEVSIKAMTAKEEDILTSRALIKKGTVITELLKSAIMEDGFDPDTMLSGDRNALMITLRATGYGSEYKCEVDCPACGVRSKQAFQLSELPLKELKIQPVAPGANLFETVLPVSKKTVRFKFLTGADEVEMSILQERKKKQGVTVDNAVTTRLQYQIVSVDGISDRTKISFFVRAMPAGDSLHLRKFIDNNEPGIEMKSWMDCPSCFETSEVRLPLGATFFWPDAG
tara:strand:+ start:203 stop:1042 length:840 start_codon:yes stop_codon:yes gene_type:complete